MRNLHEEWLAKRRGPVLRWAERLLLGGGAVALIWCALVVADGVFAQRSARRSLEAAARGVHAATTPTPALRGTTGTAVRPAVVRRGDAIAALSIPRVGLSAAVLHGSDARTLRRGPGHLEHTAMPGDPGHVVIAGHRDSFFSPLRDIRLGDDVYLDTAEGQVHYRVTSVRVVPPTDVSVLAPTTVSVLTLITCYPFWVLGDAPDRFVVRAAAVVDGVVTAFADRPAARPAAMPRDEESLVRAAVERYRAAVNARPRAGPRGRSAVLRFGACDVTVRGEKATATCETAGTHAVAGEPPARTFTLERADRGWSIKSVVQDETR